MSQWLHQLPLIVLVAVAAVEDLRRRRIPNWLTFALLGSGLIVSFLDGGLTPAQSLSGAAVGLGITLALFVLGAMAGGDAKLVAAAGAWLGPGPLILALVVAELFGATVVVLHSLHRRRLATVGRNALLLMTGLMTCRGLAGIERTAATGRGMRGIDRFLPFAVSLVFGISVVLLMRGGS